MGVKLNPYLNFSGNTKEAMEFYHHSSLEPIKNNVQKH